MIIRFYYREFSIRERCPQVDIIRLDRTARLEMTMKRHEFVALIFSDVAIYLIAAYSPEDYFSGNWEVHTRVALFANFFAHTAKNSKIKNSPFHARSLVSHSLSFSLLFILVVAHARELVAKNFCSYTFLLCLRYVSTTLRSPSCSLIKEQLKGAPVYHCMKILILY